MKSLGCVTSLGAVIMFLAVLAAAFNENMNYIWLGGVGLVFCFVLLTRIER